MLLKGNVVGKSRDADAPTAENNAHTLLEKTQHPPQSRLSRFS
jgi:hypothetical protein